MQTPRGLRPTEENPSMRSFARLPSLLLPAVLLLPSGCGGKLNRNDDVTIAVGEVRAIEVLAPLVDKATVTVKSPGSPVTVHIVYLQYRDAAFKAIQDNRPVKDEIVGVDKTEDKTFEFAPGKKEFAIVIGSIRKP